MSLAGRKWRVARDRANFVASRINSVRLGPTRYRDRDSKQKTLTERFYRLTTTRSKFARLIDLCLPSKSDDNHGCYSPIIAHRTLDTIQDLSCVSSKGNSAQVGRSDEKILTPNFSESV